MGRPLSARHQKRNSKPSIPITMNNKENHLILMEAHLWAKMIADRIDKQQRIQANFGTILAYAVETLLGIPFDHKGKEYDQTSKNFAKFLSIVHEDVKKNMAAMKQILDKKAN